MLRIKDSIQFDALPSLAIYLNIAASLVKHDSRIHVYDYWNRYYGCLEADGNGYCLLYGVIDNNKFISSK
jgi:hypothetical protein